MPELILAAAAYGGYVSPVKLAIYVVLSLAWIPIIGWVSDDADSVGARKGFWSALVLGAWAAAVAAWLILGNFFVSLAVYLVATLVPAAGYVIHRNSLVPDFQKVMTPGHIAGLFSKEAQKLESDESFIFITSNNNEVPVPTAKTPEFFGFKAAHRFFKDAVWRRAYDIIMTPEQEGYNVVYYVDGTPLQQPTMPRDQFDYFSLFVKELAGLDAQEKRKPQKGKFTIFKDGERLNWEVSTAGSTAGEQLRLKQLIQETITKLDQIGLTPDQLERLTALRDVRTGGVFIISGPPKSGVTTTLYAMLRNHDAFLNSITTVEKTVSSQLPNIVQNVFSLSDSGSGITSIGKKLLSVVRMDPDIVGVGDCSDSETAQVAVTAATDGKRVYLSLEAENVLKALSRWIKLVGDKNKAIDPLLGISNQRIVRRLCEECRQAYEPNPDLLRKFNIPADKAKVLYREGKVVYDKRGKPSPCDHCQETGFYGRMCVFETVIIDQQMRAEIKKAKSLSDVATVFRRARMLYLQEQALRRVMAGTTSINEMVRALSVGKEQPARKQAAPQ
jgi:type II secretory ATPase GspE/PulE/Tfp pilus assembly ATPase PilB-like protein